LINKTIPNFRKLVCIFGGLMPQTRRRRWIRSSGDSTWPAQEQMPGGSSSHASAPQPPTCVNWDDDMDDFMPPKPWPPTHDVPPPVHEPRIRKETKGKARGSSSHVAPPAAQTCVNWDDDMDDFMPPKPWPPTHDVPPPVHERRSRKERKGKPRGSSSHTTPPAAPPSVNWDDDLDDFMP
jgi:hypothetical protein